MIDLIVPPENGGQIVTTSYSASLKDWGYRLCFDQSDRSEQWHRCRAADVVGEWEPWNRAPEVDEADWQPCDRPEE